MRMLWIVALCAAVALCGTGCAAFGNLINNTAAQQAAASLGGEGAAYVALTVIQYESPGNVAQAESDIKDISATLQTLAGGTVDVNSVVLTLNDFKIGVGLIPQQYQSIATALLSLIPSSVNVPTSAIPAQYITLIRDFLGGVDSGLAAYVAANPPAASLPKAAQAGSLDPLHHFVDNKSLSRK
jgi:hypothetical protein